MRKAFWIYLAAGAILVLAACGGGAEETPAIEAGLQETPTATLEPSATNPPEEAASSTATVLPPSVTPTPTVKVDYLSTPDIATQIPFLEEAFGWTDVSPDGQWTATGLAKLGIQGEGEQELYYVKLLVSNLAGTIEWTIEDVLPYGLGYLLPQPVMWAQDSSALYYSNSGTPDGCGVFNFGDLWRMNLSDGSVTEVMELSASIPAPSPDGSQVAFVPWSYPPVVAIREVESGSERRISLDIAGDQAGGLAWSEDGSQLFLTVSVDSCLAGWKQGILAIDVETLEQRVLVEPDERLLKTVEWVTPNFVRVIDKDQGLWLLNVETGELTAEGGKKK